MNTFNKAVFSFSLLLLLISKHSLSDQTANYLFGWIPNGMSENTQPRQCDTIAILRLQNVKTIK